MLIKQNLCGIIRWVPRQFTGRTVHRRVFWRQFTDIFGEQFTNTFGDSSPTHFFFFFKRMFMTMETMFHILIEENVGKLKTKVLWLIQYFEYRQGTLYTYEVTHV